MRSFDVHLKLAFFALCFYTTSSISSTFYVHPTDGFDQNPGTDPAGAWRSFSKVNSSAKPGDRVLLASGQTFHETLVLRSGITYGKYGGADSPIISGRKRIDLANVEWSKSSSAPIYSAILPSSFNSGPVSTVFFGNERLTRARVPNPGAGSFPVPQSQFARVSRDGDPWTLHVSQETVPSGADVAGATAMIRSRGSDLGEYSIENWQNKEFRSLRVKPVSFTEDWYIAHEYTILAGYGYWIENKLWMLDSPGEWFYDTVSRRLHVWMPNSQSPQGQDLYASVLQNGIVGQGIKGVSVSDLHVVDTSSDGISVFDASDVILNNISVLRAGRRGISFAGSFNSTFNNIIVDSSAAEGIWLGYVSTSMLPKPPSKIARSINVSIRDSSILNSGRRGYAQAAVRLGEGGSFTRNKVVNTPYHGIFSTINNYISDNFVFNSCSGYDDCGGIYVAQPPADPNLVLKAGASTPVTRTRFASRISIVNNYIEKGSGSNDGVPHGAGDDTRGIYLDDYANGVQVIDNVVIGMKYGYMLHTAFNNVVKGNSAIHNRFANILLQEDEVPTHGGQIFVRGELIRNAIEENSFVAGRSGQFDSGSIPHIWHTAQGGQGQTQRFARYDRNHYATIGSNASQMLAYTFGSDNPLKALDFSAWRSLGNDKNGTFRAYLGESEAFGFYNSSVSEILVVQCPTRVADNCNRFIDLKTREPIVFPYTLSPRASLLTIR